VVLVQILQSIVNFILKPMRISIHWVKDEFPYFKRPNVRPKLFTMLPYQDEMAPRLAGTVIKRGVVIDTLTEVLSKLGFTNFRTAEPEKAPHVTYFAGGQHDEAFPGQVTDIPTSQEGDWEGNAKRAVDVALEMARSNKNYTIQYSTDPNKGGVQRGESFSVSDDQLLVINLAGGDIAGHKNFNEAKKAVAAIDVQLKRLVDGLREKGYRIIITADHGSAEHMADAQGNPYTSHTANPVPAIVIGPEGDDLKSVRLKQGMGIRHVASSIMELLGLRDRRPMSWESSIFEEAPPAPLTGSKKAALIVLDAWGINPNAADPYDAIRGNAPNFDALRKNYPYTTLQASGNSVGLRERNPTTNERVQGNSEVGHVHLLSGRLIPQSQLLIDQLIRGDKMADGLFSDETDFYDEHRAFDLDAPAISDALRYSIAHHKPLHLLGQVSEGDVHSSLFHLYAILRLAKKMDFKEKIYIHAITDGRDAPVNDGLKHIKKLEKES